MSKKLFIPFLVLLFTLSFVLNTTSAETSSETADNGDNCIVIDLNELDREVKQEYLDLANKYKSVSSSCDTTSSKTKESETDGTSEEKINKSC